MTRRGFTVIELLIVVIVLGILAAVAVQQFARCGRDAREIATARSVTILAKAIYRYHLNHDKFPGFPPGGGEPNEATFVKQLTHYSDYTGDTSDEKDRDKWPYGPYLRDGIPVNPLNGSAKVKLIRQDGGIGARVKPLEQMKKAEILSIDNTAFDDDYGWIYCPDTGDIIPND